MTDSEQKIDIADKRTEVLKNIHELKRHILPHLHTNYLDARKYLTSIMTYKNDFTIFDMNVESELKNYNIIDDASSALNVTRTLINTITITLTIFSIISLH